jgi:D-beta-D-heptose 7-phosphate kinase/D-beta-D-heptose 1-phosphate adenosyltransferase
MELKNLSNKIVFTNGCFDIIHAGHIELLKYARSLGDKLIVGLNTDRSVKENKGSHRPINTQENRKTVLESVRWVDEVILFDEKTPINLINAIDPDIIVKGSDYVSDEVIGKHIAEVRIFELVDGLSTTKTIENISNR